MFKLKQPPLGRRRRMSAREIGKDLGVDIDRVMAALADLGEYAQSPASKLEEPVIRRLYEAFSAQHEPAKPKSPPEWQWKSQSDQVPLNAKPAGNDSAEAQTSWHSRARGDWWETHADAAPAWELESWKIFGFTETEREVWIAHGLRPGQVKDAVSFRDAGLVPADLPQEIGGWTVLKRLRAGERPTEVVRLLRAAREDDRAG